MSKPTTREMVEAILTNDLPHIRERLVKVEVRQTILIFLALAIFAGVIESIFKWGM